MSAGDLPLPRSLTALPRELLGELVAQVGEPTAVAACVDLLRGADPAAHGAVLPYLAGRPGAAYFEGGWVASWPRVWGARGLLYVWDDSVTGVTEAVLGGLRDPAWRVAEMCLKVSALRALPAGDGAVALAGHPLPRVRAAALRALGAGGDVEHVEAVRAALGDPGEEVRRAAGRAVDLMTRRLDLT